MPLKILISRTLSLQDRVSDPRKRRVFVDVWIGLLSLNQIRHVTSVDSWFDGAAILAYYLLWNDS